MIAGTLEVQLQANLARLADDMSKVKGMVGGAMAEIERTVGKAKAALAALGIGLSIGGLAAMVKNAIDAADHLNDLSKKTGIAVETLGGIGFAAKKAGLDLDSVAAGAGKLNKSIAEAAGGNKEFVAAFNALGVNLRTASGQLKTADVVLGEVSDKFKDFDDGPEKAALALRLFGKAGADMIPLLNEGSASLQTNIEYWQKYSGVTQQVAEQSDAFNDEMEKAKLLTGSFGQTLSAELLPTLQALVESFVRTKEEGGIFTDVAGGIVTVFNTLVVLGANVAYVFESIRDTIGGLAAQIVALTTLDFKAVGAIDDAIIDRNTRARREIDAFGEKVLGGSKAASAGPLNEGLMASVAAKKARAPLVPGTGTQGDDPAKKQLEGRLKDIERALQRERDTIKFHDEYIAELRAQDLVDQQTYEEYRRRSLESTYATTVRNYDAQIAILEQYIATATKAVDRQSAENKLKEAQDAKEKARLEFIQKGEMLTLSLAKAQNDLNKEMKEWGIRQEQSAKDLEFEIEVMGKSSFEIAKLTEARRMQLEVEEKIREARKSGEISEETIANIQRQADAAKARTARLMDEKDAKERDPWFNAQESIRKYGEEASNVGKQIGDAVTNGMRAAEDAFVDFVTTGKFSFSDLARSILADLVRIQARNLIASITGAATGGGGSSGGGGFGGLLGGLFGGGTPSFSGFDIGGLAGGFSAAANPFSMFGFANGGEPPVGRPSLVGERGPEVFVPKVAGTVVPNHMLGGKSVSVVIHQHNQFESGLDRTMLAKQLTDLKEATKAEIENDLERAG